MDHRNCILGSELALDEAFHSLKNELLRIYLFRRIQGVRRVH